MDISGEMMKVGELNVDEYLNGKSMHLLDVSSVLSESDYSFMLKTIQTEDLAKLHRTLIMTEEYDCVPLVHAELIRRGYTVTILEKSIKYTYNG